MSRHNYNYIIFLLLASLLPQSGTHSCLVFALVLHRTHSIVFLKRTVSIRPLVPPVAHTHTSASDSASG